MCRASEVKLASTHVMEACTLSLVFCKGLAAYVDWAMMLPSAGGAPYPPLTSASFADGLRSWQGGQGCLAALFSR